MDGWMDRIKTALSEYEIRSDITPAWEEKEEMIELQEVRKKERKKGKGHDWYGQDRQHLNDEKVQTQ